MVACNTLDPGDDMRTRTSTTRRTAIVAFAAALLPCAVRAQTQDPAQASTHAFARITVTPYAGMYASIGKLRADSTVEFLQLMTLVAGARAALQLNHRFAIEAAGGWTPAPSWVAQSDWEQTIDVPGRVALGSLRGRYDLNPDVEAGDWVVSLASGIGAVHRYGQAWEGLSGTTDVAFVFGATSRLRPFSSRLSYGLDVDGFVSRAEFRDYLGQRTRARLHADLVLSLALSLSL
jgi:hypothetical protein